MTQIRSNSDILLKRFNSFIVLRIEPKEVGKKTNVLTVCNCGSVAARPLYRVVSGFIKACNKCKGSTRNISKESLYSVWRGIKMRCYLPSRKEYHNYGGRGISMYKDWIDNPSAFMNYCLDNGWKKELQVDRIDNSGNYEPGNIRFVNAQANMSNTRMNKYCLLDGVKMTLSEASRKLGKDRTYLCSVQTRYAHLKPSNVIFL